MGSISDKLTYLLDTKAAIRQAIREKGVDVPEEDTFRNYAERIRSIVQTGKDIVSISDVTFIDCDGTTLFSYTTEEFLALTEMPPLPAKTGLTCQGWNYTLEDAKTLAAQVPYVTIGATYITNDGKTRLYIRVLDTEEAVKLNLDVNILNSVTIDWGDGSDTETNSKVGDNSWAHTYPHIGDYIITITPTDEVTFGLGYGTYNTSSNPSYPVIGYRYTTSTTIQRYSGYLNKIEIGKRVIGLAEAMSFGIRELKDITIPSNVQNSVGTKAFSYSTNLESIVLPASIPSIGSYAFEYCYSLRNVAIPAGVTSIGSYAFEYCYILECVVIPAGVTSIGGYAFQYCFSLRNIVIPAGVTTINTYMFAYCLSLATIKMLGSITTISTYAFTSCPRLRKIDLRYCTAVPTLSSINAISNNTDLQIIVSDDLYDTWIAATNWASFSSKIIKASDYDAVLNQ